MESKRVYGAYTITCAANGRYYVGSSSNVRRRWLFHRSLLSRGKHFNAALQADWDEHGESAFRFRVTGESRDAKLRLAMEQAGLDGAFAAGLAYNVYPTAGSARGYKWSPEQRDTLSEALTGLPKSADHRAKIADMQVRTWAARDPEAVRERMADMGRANLGKPKSAEHRRNIAKARTGKSPSEATRRKLSESHKGQRNAARITEDLAREIRRRADAGENMAAVAREFADQGVTYKMACDIKKRLTWRDLT